MKQLLSVLALASLAVACGDDGSSTPTTHLDGGTHDATVAPGSDSGQVTVKVTNVGHPCVSATDCTGGSSAICETMSFTGAADPGGQCSAVCTAGAECGPKGVCPAGEAIEAFKNYPGNLTKPLGTEGHCAQSCSLTDPTSCTHGYNCVTLNYLAMASGTPVVHLPGTEFLDTPFCAPLPARDGGVPDAGTTAKIVGMDSGL